MTFFANFYTFVLGVLALAFFAMWWAVTDHPPHPYWHCVQDAGIWLLLGCIALYPCLVIIDIGRRTMAWLRHKIKE
jgi:hypothetical protein